jgi:hypothetical protein
MIARFHLPDTCSIVISLLEVGLLRMVAARFEKKRVLQGNGHGTQKNTSHLSSSMQIHDLHFVPIRFLLHTEMAEGSHYAVKNHCDRPSESVFAC